MAEKHAERGPVNCWWALQIGAATIENSTEISKKKVPNRTPRGLPCWPSSKESTCECRRHGFDPWSGKISHGAEKEGLCTTSMEL